MVNTFNFASTPKIYFGSGKLKLLPKLIEPYGSSVLLVTGSKSFVGSEFWEKLLIGFEDSNINWKYFVIDREPTPVMIDQCVSSVSKKRINCVVAIGGGSVIDAGKAISAMLTEKGSIVNYLEGVGNKQPSGKKIPFIAIPTTSGTGSETTKNAVISEIGENGFKKSLRHDNYVPDIAIVDPKLTVSCPLDITVQGGMDAFTQLLESYVSTKSNPMTDSLVVEGIRKIRDGLQAVVADGFNLLAREKMAYASMTSGITLANAGLGTIHGFASSIGGFFDIPHGLICARLMGPVNKLTVEKLMTENPGSIGLLKYARIGKLFSKDKNNSDAYYVETLLNVIERYTEEFKLKKLSDFGIEETDFQKIIDATGNKYNPIDLDCRELEYVLKQAL